MPKPELTKKLIADTLKKLASGKHLDKISVSEIVNTAGLNRQTFYYHFQDKSDLICWIFDTDFAALTDKNENNTLLDDMVEYMYSEKEFYIDALTSTMQNNLREHFYKVWYKQCIDAFLSMLDKRTMDEKAIIMFACLFTNALTGSLVQWAQEGMQADDIPFLEEYVPMFRELLVAVVENYAKSDGGV